MMTPPTRLLIEKLKELSVRGINYREAAIEIGSSHAYLVSFSHRHGIKFGRRKPQAPILPIAGDHKPNARSQNMASLYKQGATLAEIGTQYGITRERVRQILRSDHDMRGSDGGISFTATLARAARLNAKEAACQRKFGCSRAQYRGIRPSARRAYTELKRNAKRDEYRLDLTLWQWWTLWQESGHWNDRGRGQGYWLFRLRSDAPLSPDNFCIAPGNEAMSLMRQVDPSRFLRDTSRHEAAA